MIFSYSSRSFTISCVSWSALLREELSQLRRCGRLLLFEQLVRLLGRLVGHSDNLSGILCPLARLVCRGFLERSPSQSIHGGLASLCECNSIELCLLLVVDANLAKVQLECLALLDLLKHLLSASSDASLSRFDRVS